jgi:hypothetical protein
VSINHLPHLIILLQLFIRDQLSGIKLLISKQCRPSFDDYCWERYVDLRSMTTVGDDLFLGLLEKVDIR